MTELPDKILIEAGIDSQELQAIKNRHIAYAAIMITSILAIIFGLLFLTQLIF